MKYQYGYLKLLFILGGFSIFSSCKGTDYRRDEIIDLPCENSTIEVKISYPETDPKNAIIVWSTPSLNRDYYPDSITDDRKIWLPPVLRKIMLDSGYINIEYIGRNDTIQYYNHNYPAADLYTKAADLENLLDYISQDKYLKNKKVILAGHSEGADINCIVASKRHTDIAAIILMSAAAQSGKEITKYQREQNLLELVLRLTCYGNQEAMDKTVNKMSSLDSYHKADIDGAMQFVKENIEPIENIVYQHNNNDSIYFHIDKYLRDRWNMEIGETKNFELYRNDYESYYRTFAGNLTPQQIAVRKFDPAKYYPFIKCPVLAVHGTKDERIECEPNISNMERLLTEGGNLNFEKMILVDYNHNLVKEKEAKKRYFIEENVVSDIIEWIDGL